MSQKPTLLIVDVQKAFDDPEWGTRNNPGAEGNVADAAGRWAGRDQRSQLRIHRNRSGRAASCGRRQHGRDRSHHDRPLWVNHGEESGNLGFETWVVGDACAAFDRKSPDGEVFPADLIHRTSLASLHDEFADVVSTDEAIARLG